MALHSEAPPEAKLPSAKVTFRLQSRNTSSPLSCSLHAWGRLSAEPSRLAAEELALGWLAGGDHRRISALEPRTVWRGKRTVEKIQSTRNTGQSIKWVSRFVVASSVNPVLPLASLQLTFMCCLCAETCNRLAPGESWTRDAPDPFLTNASDDCLERLLKLFLYSYPLIYYQTTSSLCRIYSPLRPLILSHINSSFLSCKQSKISKQGIKYRIEYDYPKEQRKFLPNSEI